MKKNSKLLSVTLFLILTYFIAIPNTLAKKIQCTYNKTINVGGLDSAYNGSKTIDLTNIVKYCDHDFDTSTDSITSAKGDYVNATAKDNKVTLWYLNNLKNDTTETEITIKYKKPVPIGSAFGSDSHTIVAKVKLVKTTLKPEITKEVTINTKELEIKSLVEEYMKTHSTNKEFDETKYKYKSKNLVKNGNIAFLTGMPGDINKVAVDVNALAKQTNSISNNLIIKYSYAGTNYQLTVHVNYKYGFGITTINKNYNQKDFEHGSIKINLKNEVAKSQGNVSSSRVTIESIDSGNGFLVGKKDANEIIIFAGEVKTLKVNTVSNLNFKYRIDGGVLKTGIFKANIKVDGSQTSSNKTDTGTTTPEEEACYEFSNTGIYYWGTKTNAEAKSQGMMPKITTKTKAECNATNATKKDTDEEADAAQTPDSGLASGTSSVTELGENACKSYIIRRVRGYNSSSTKIPTYNDSYFRSAIGLAGSAYQYYYVYKATYNCSGYDKNTNVTAFCIDPGARGAENTGTKYNVGKTIDKDKALGKGLYHLYTYWYLDHRSEISSTYSGTSPNGAEDLVDYVINNVARQLVSKYGAASGITFTNPLKNGYGNKSQLTYEYNAYKTKTVGIDALSSLKSKEILTKVWQDTDDYASGRKKDESNQTDVKFGINLDSSSTKNSKKGFDAEFTVTIQTQDKDILKAITENYKITATVVENGTEKDITDGITSSIDESGWQTSSDGTTMTAKFKASAEDIYSYVSESAVDNVKINFNIHYSDKRSINNIMYLTPTGGKYQKFISFLNGTIDTKRSVSIEMGKQEVNNCRPTFAMPCVDKETVVYLIEGTQSGTLYNTVMNGIKSAGDVKNIISNAYNMVKSLLDNGLSGLGDSELKLISSFIYNIADKVNITGNIKNELSFLQTLGNNGNNTAKQLYQLLTNTQFTSDSKQNYTQLQSLFVSSILNALTGGYDKLVSEWQEILATAEKQVSNSKLSKSTYELLENIQNLITSAKDGNGLSGILKGATTLAENFFKDLTDVSSIKELAVSFGAAISGAIQSASGNLQNIYQQLSNTWSQIFNINSLSDINISGLYNSLTSAFTVDWEKCIIGEGNTEATDPGGNSYTVQAQNMYCKVVCKEDYAIKMPGNLGTVYAGQNLSTNIDNIYHATIGMAGQRTCVSTKIDNDSYVNDAAAVKDNILTAYNEFQKHYAHYKELKNNYSQFENKDKEAYNDKKVVSVDISLDGVKADFENVIKTTMSTFLTNLVNPTNEEQRDLLDTLKQELTNSLAGDNGIVMKLIGTFMQKGSIGADDISSVLTSSIGSKGEELANGFKKRFEDALSTTATSLQNQLETIAKKYATDGVLSVGSTAGKMALSAACKILTRLPYVNAVATPVCEAYAGATTIASNAITSVSKATINNLKIFAIHDYSNISLDGSYNKFKYNTTNTDNVSKLKASITENSEIANEGNLTFSKDRKQLWVMESGSYNVSTTYFGISVDLTMLKKAFDSFSNLGNADYGVISDTLEYITKTVSKLGESTSYSGAKGSKEALEKMQNSGVLDNVLSIIGNLTQALGDISGALGNAQTDITKYVDTALDGIYYLLGAFNPYYYQVALVREQMLNAKNQYDEYRKQLEQLAGNMNQCTMFANEYEFDPDLVFTYGYPNNSLLDYIVDKKNSTADSIRLQAINPQESAETVTYYCKDDVPINNIQDISTIMSGKCTTSDGMFGGIVASVFGSDSQMSTILKKFQENSDGLRKLLNNDKVKEYINSTGYASKLNDVLCSGLGTSFCDLLDTDDTDGDSLITNVPGDIVYTLKDTKLSTSSWSNVKSIFSGGIHEIDKNITNSLKYTTTGDNKFTYRNAKRVVSVSRYGNPGVSISGLSFTSLLSNIASWISSEAGGTTSDALNKINDTVMSVTGQGAQKFIYYQSSLPYFTTSNKGIYTTSSAPSDAIYIDAGDKALTDDKIKTTDGSKKEANGLVYPIALSTASGTYSYQIKINNVGQYYNNTLGLGRIIDNNGYVSGLLANQYVCKYEVETEPPTPNASCEEILETSDCKDENGYFKDLYKNQNYDKTNGIDYEAKWNACITKLLSENDSCCYLIDANNVPNASQNRYNSMCNSKCQGIKLYGSDSAIKDSSTSSSALISKNGVLQFYTKVISNYDYFPNGEGSKGFNWSGKTSGYENVDESGNPVSQDINTIINNKEEIGDGIYGDVEKYLNYSINISSACMAKIKEYNDQQELNDLGFGDYTGGIENVKTREYRSQFLKDLEESSEYAVCREKPIINQLQK